MNCPKCSREMETRTHKEGFKPKKKTSYFTQWDFCTFCGFLQHYEKYRIWVGDKDVILEKVAVAKKPKMTFREKAEKWAAENPGQRSTRVLHLWKSEVFRRDCLRILLPE